jgi:hypothetical protein
MVNTQLLQYLAEIRQYLSTNICHFRSLGQISKANENILAKFHWVETEVNRLLENTNEL